MAIPSQTSFQFQHIAHPVSSGSYRDPSLSAGSTSSDPTALNGHLGSKKQKTTPPCDRCRQRRIKCDRLEPTCSSCVKYKATCVRTAFPAGAPLSTVSVEAIGGPGLRILTSGKRDRHITETEILDSCLRDVHSLQLSRLRRIEQFFDMLGLDETRLDEVGWLTEQIKIQQDGGPATNDMRYRPEEIAEKLGPRAPISWVKQLMPLLQATKRVQQIPSTAHSYPTVSATVPSGLGSALHATLSESGNFICPAPKPTPFPNRVPLSVLNKTMFELSVYDCTQYLGPVAGTKATSWNEEMRFPLPWLVPEPQLQEALLVLPPMEQMLELIEWTIQSPLYTYFPILTKASILNALSSAAPGPGELPLDFEKSKSQAEESRALPQRITGRVSAVFLLNAIMALGAAYRANAIKENTPHRLLNDPKSRETTLYDFQLFFDRSRALTVYILDQPRVSSLQGLLLLMKCPSIPGIQNLYREQACAMALALGLHRDPEPWTLCRSVIQLRRNIFWCCYVIDASYSLNAASPERFPDDYITIGLPTMPSIDSGDDVGEIEAETETQRIGFLIEQAKLWRIVKKIRRCGQTSNKYPESYCEGANLFRSPEASTVRYSPHSAHPGHSVFGQTPHTRFGEGGASVSAPTPPPWVWRADSARRILDVELAQWQMELPPHLRFDFALTREDDPCPYAVRVNGLGAMLQVIFNEVLILLHHPFLILADSQSQLKRDQGMRTPSRRSKSRSSSGSIRSPRSRSASSVSKYSTSSSFTGGPPHSEDSMSKTSRSLPPFLNSCTKAAEAITFLIDHLLRTTPEWLVCHNEVESALHIAERVHALNVTMAADRGSSEPYLIDYCYAIHVNGQQAKCQLKRTKAFRKAIKELDQFTMSTGYRPELVTRELLARGSPRERLMRSMKQLLAHRRGPEYYRLPRSPPETDSIPNASACETDGRFDSGAGQDHLEMQLSFVDHRIWIRYYNIRIKDGVESKNGAESWLEILNPFTCPAELEVDTEDDEEDPNATHVLGYPSTEDTTMPIYEDEEGFSDGLFKKGSQRRRTSSGGDKGDLFDILDEPMDPPQSSSTALMETFSNPNPSGLVNFTDMIAGSAYYPNHQKFANKKDVGKDYGVIELGYDIPIVHPGPYVPQDVSLDSFDRIDPPFILDGPSNRHDPDIFQPNYRLRGLQAEPRESHFHDQYQQQEQMQQMQQRQYSFHPGASPLQLQQRDQRGSLQNFDYHPSSMPGLDPAVSATSFSSPGSPDPSTTTEPAMGLGILPVSNCLSLQPSLAFDGGRYLSLLQQHFPHQQMPSQPHGGASMQSFQQEQSLDPSLNAVHQSVRPFYGMPVGGFMTPSLSALPGINRASVQQGNANISRTDFLATTPSPTSGQHHQQTNGSASWSLDGQVKPTSGAPSHSGRSEHRSPALPTSLSSIPTSPLPSSTLGMMLSPTSDALQGISNTLNSWNGLSGPNADTQIDYPITSSSSTFQPNLTSLNQQLGAAAGINARNYANSWSSTSSTSDLVTNNSTPGSTGLSDTGLFPGDMSGGNVSVLKGPLKRTSEHRSMDGIEAGSSSTPSPRLLSENASVGLHHQHRHPISAVPEVSLFDLADDSIDDGTLSRTGSGANRTGI